MHNIIFFAVIEWASMKMSKLYYILITIRSQFTPNIASVID